jgi:hypothetical protein
MPGVFCARWRRRRWSSCSWHGDRRPARPRPCQRADLGCCVSHAWHTDIAVPMSDIAGTNWPDANRFPGAAFIEVGWGNATSSSFSPISGPRGLCIARAFLSSPNSLPVGAVLCQAARIGRVVRLRYDRQAHAPPDQTARGDPLHAAARIDSIWVTARSQSKAVVMCSRPAPASRARSAGSSTRLAILAARSSTSRRRATRAVTPSTA